MAVSKDGPFSDKLEPVLLEGNISFDELAESGISPEMAESIPWAPTGECVAWGIRFQIEKPMLISDQDLMIDIPDLRSRWLVFMHTSDLRQSRLTPDGFISPMRGQGQLGEHAADYVIVYEDGSEKSIAIKRRHQIGAFQRRWGENCFQSVAHRKPRPIRAHHEQMTHSWGVSQTRVSANDGGRWINWLWAWENPHPEKRIKAIKIHPVSGKIVLSAISHGDLSSNPLRWNRREKALLKLPEGEEFRPELDENGLLSQIQLDMGQVISATKRLVYPNERWENTYNNQLPEISQTEVLIEYAAHPEASFHLSDGRRIPVGEVKKQISPSLISVPPSHHRVELRVTDSASGKPVPVKLHVHGEFGEYLAPNDRHRQINTAWFEDYSPEFSHANLHSCTYIPGETVLNLPLGKVYVEISKGFEIKPIRRVIEITPETKEVVVEIERVLPWREKGWVTADTHVHFLSPMTALLEGSAEGVNVVNLLASQWGELMTNVGDFDGTNTWGSKETGGDGEYLVRVGTENRQHVLGHISLLGYRGRIISPMTTGGPDESAIGDPIDMLLTEWARACKRQGGLVVLPHFPNPRAEHAASLILGDIDAVEMTSWGNLYGGIDPYSLSDWYRYLNCGYLVPAVGGTDKMSASTAVGTVRTYARIPDGEQFTYETWMEAVRRAETFVTYGPLIEFNVEGKPMGSKIAMSASGGRVDVSWEVASVTIPITRVELVMNGEIVQDATVSPSGGSGYWSVKIDRSSWLALLIRGGYEDKPEIIAAHSSPVMLSVEGSRFLPAADALTILEQIEGALAYLDTIGTRADDVAYKRMRMVLLSAHRALHNRMHQNGCYHDHTAVNDHPEHH